MKRSYNFLAIIMILFTLFVFNDSFAQRDVGGGNNGTGYTFITHYDTVTTPGGNVSSTAFTLTDNLSANWVTYPWNFEVTATAPSGTPKGTIYIQKGYSATGTFTNADTLQSTDSTYTNTCFQADLNSWKFPYYKIKYVTTSASAANVRWYLRMGNPRKN